MEWKPVSSERQGKQPVELPALLLFLNESSVLKHLKPNNQGCPSLLFPVLLSPQLLDFPSLSKVTSSQLVAYLAS